MKVVHHIEELRRRRREGEGRSWGFVPTMGFLHEGHLSLVRRAREENDLVAVSLFVNPAQFGEAEDLAKYPRSLERDLDLLRQEGVDLVFSPSDGEMYPPGFQTYVTVQEIARPLEGSSRPTHFQGVATVLSKLFLLIRPRRAYFGQKDAQQCVVVERLVTDLAFDLQVVVAPTVREPDGLAMSSRNARLTPPQRAAAAVVYRSLQAAAAAITAGERDAEAVREEMRRALATEPLGRIDYVSVADPETLEELDRIDGGALVSLAVFFGKIRLIDNLPVEAGGFGPGAAP